MLLRYSTTKDYFAFSSQSTQLNYQSVIHMIDGQFAVATIRPLRFHTIRNPPVFRITRRTSLFMIAFVLESGCVNTLKQVWATGRRFGSAPLCTTSLAFASPPSGHLSVSIANFMNKTRELCENLRVLLF
jgi:hypothetical protein